MNTQPHTVTDRAEHRRRRHPTASYADRLAATKQHDAQVCTCAHRCATHGSYIAGDFVGIGQGPCGWPGCDCERFAANGAHSYAPITAVPDYTRPPADEDRACPDCRAEPGEPCHWACSSWWTANAGGPATEAGPHAPAHRGRPRCCAPTLAPGRLRTLRRPGVVLPHLASQCRPAGPRGKGAPRAPRHP